MYEFFFTFFYFHLFIYFQGISGHTAFYGSSIDIGDFAVYIPENKNNTHPTRAQTERTPLESYPGIYKKRKIESSKELENTQYYGTFIKEEDQWKMKQYNI